MLTRSLRLLLSAFVLCFATGALLNPAAAKTVHKKAVHHAQTHESSGPPLVIRGDQVTLRGLVRAVTQAYEETGNGRLVVQPFNTISGIDAALNGSADIAGSARASFPGRAQEAGLNFTPVAWDALVMITSPANPVSNITLRQLREIYSGKITNWSQLGGKDEPIDLYTIASPLAGAEYSLRRLLYGRGNAPIVMPRMYINVDTLEQGVALDPKSLGLSTLSGVHDNKKVRVIPIEGVMPSTATVADGSYPLYTSIYLASSPTSTHAAEIAKFMDFLGSDKAKRLMRAHDLLPYGDAPALQSPDQQLAAVSTKMISEGLPPSEAPNSAGDVAVASAAIPTPQPQPAPPLQTPAPTVAPTQVAPMQPIAQAAPVRATVAPSYAVAAAADLAHAKVTSSARTASDPSIKHAEAIAPSNPVVVSTGGAVTPVQSADPSIKHAEAIASSNPVVVSTGGAVTPVQSADPSIKHAEAIAPSNPVVVSTGGAVTPVQSIVNPNHPTRYVVTKGDTLLALARKFSVSVADLRKWNNLKGDGLQVGQVLHLTTDH